MGKKGLGLAAPSRTPPGSSNELVSLASDSGRSTPIRYFENGHARNGAVPASPPDVEAAEGWDWEDEDWNEEEAPLMVEKGGESRGGDGELGWLEGVARELRLQGGLAMPIAVMQVLWFLRMVVSLAFLGRISEADLAGAALALVIANVTGYSALFGLASGLDPLCSQAFGAGEFSQVGVILQRGWGLLLLSCIPSLVIWFNVEPLLNLLGQDPILAHKAGSFLRYLAPDLVITALVQPLRSFLRSQGLVYPIALGAGVAFALHIPANFLFCHVLKFSAPGTAIALTLTSTVFFLALILYVRLIPGPHRKAWDGALDLTALNPLGWGPLLRLAVPSAVSICLEWWAFEAVTLLAGWLENAHTAVAAMSLTATVSSLVYMLPLALEIAAAVRVGTELGAGMPIQACLSAEVGTVLGCILGAISFGVLTFYSHSIARIFTNEEAVVDLVGILLPVLGVCELFNCPQAVLGGVLRGAGRPKATMFVGLGAYYIVGLPLAGLLAFKLSFGVTGFWWGLTAGQFVQAVVLGWLVFRCDWIELAMQAKRLVSLKPEKSHSALFEIGDDATLLDEDDEDKG